MNASEYTPDNRGIVRNDNGFSAFCFHVRDYCIHPHCLTCESYVKPVFIPLAPYDWDEEFCKYLDASPNALEILSGEVRAWYRKRKARYVRLTMRYDCAKGAVAWG